MANPLKKHGFSLSFPRLFTRADEDAFDRIHFREPDFAGDEITPALACPDHWSNEAAELLAERAAHLSVPLQTKTTEENTVPSWLWRRTGVGKEKRKEDRVQDLFTRAVGSATYAGWKLHLFMDENAGRNFYDEMRYALAQRFIAIDPEALAELGLDWAYGIKTPKTKKTAQAAPQSSLSLSNKAMDALASGRKGPKRQAPQGKAVTMVFADTVADWGEQEKKAPHASLDLLPLRHNDGSVNIEALRHSVRLLVTFFDLQSDVAEPFTIGFTNLAPLLMALGLAYDSEAARSTAASLASIVTAEAYSLSAKLAGLRGPSADFTRHHQTVMRALRNHRRAVYGDPNDYEKISVVPVPLNLTECPDLALVAAAQRGWDEALENVKHYGLRALQITSLSTSKEMALFMESAAESIEPVRSLVTLQPSGDDGFERIASSFVSEGLTRRGYDRAAVEAIGTYIAGTKTLLDAPVINHASLRAKGFTRDALECIENYLPNVDDIRLAFTPWVLGEAFCRKILKIPAAKLQNPLFNLLRELRYTDANIKAANMFCYGHGTAQGAKALRVEDVPVFVRTDDVLPEAKIRMAASVQSFIAGDTGLSLSLPTNLAADKKDKLTLNAWRQGLKTLHLSFDAPIASQEVRATKMAAFLHTKTPSLPARKTQSKAQGCMLGLKPAHSAKTTLKNRGR